MTRHGIRLQELIAAALALACAGFLVLTARHLVAGVREIDREVAALRATYRELIAGCAGPGDISAWESAIDDKVRIKGRLIDVRDQERNRQAVARRGLDATVRQAAQGGIAGDYPWNPGPEPDLWFSPLRAEWQKWYARKAACEALDEQYRLGKGELNQLGITVPAAELAVERIEGEIAHLRTLKNQAIAVMRDPGKLRELETATKGSPLAKLALFAFHLPLAGYFLVLLLRFSFRLALMREWMGAKRLADAG